MKRISERDRRKATRQTEQETVREAGRQPGRNGESVADRIARQGSFTAPPGVRRIALALPALLIVVGFVLNEATSHDYSGGPFFTAAPLVAAPFTSTRVTALTGALSVLLLALLRIQDQASGSMEDAARTLTVAVVAVLAIGINRLLGRRGAALASARIVSEAAQLAVLPEPPSRIGGLSVAARYRAAQADARIGGDLYAAQETPYGTRLIIGDVRGKGMDAVETVVIVIGAFREAAEQEATIEAVAARLERALRREGTRRRALDEYEGFTTATIAEIPAGQPEKLRLVNRGHPSPLLLGDGHVRFLHPAVPAMPLGMPDLGQGPDRADEVEFPLGTQLLLYTDGLSEARDRNGVFFEPDKALAGRVFAHPDMLLDAVLADVAAHTGGGSTDDMALMAAQRRSRADS